MMAEPRFARARWLSCWVLALFYSAAGALHLLHPAPFLAITPGWVPFAATVVALTGVAELTGAMGLLLPRWRRAAAIGLTLYALCVWPANFNHMLIDDGANILYHAIRLPLQIPLMWWTLWAGGVVHWPWRKEIGTG
jgi:uncharacterized membrane protein